MGSKRRNHRGKVNFELNDDFDDLYDHEFDIRDVADAIYSADWNVSYDSQDDVTARRQIERRSDLKKLYSQLDEWEEFGEDFRENFDR